MAVNAYTAVIRWDPDHVQALQQRYFVSPAFPIMPDCRCLLHMKMKKYAEADVDAFRLQQLLPTSAVVTRNKCSVAFEQLSCLQGYQLRGRIYISTEQYGKASFEFQLALSVEPDLQVLKLKEWADKLMTLSLQRYATETSNREAITGEEPSTSVEYLHTVLEAAKICGGNISPQGIASNVLLYLTVNDVTAAALYVDVVPSVATFSTTSCVVEEELEKHSEAAGILLPRAACDDSCANLLCASCLPAVTADQAAAIASAAKWPIGDEVDPHDCAKSSKCIQVAVSAWKAHAVLIAVCTAAYLCASALLGGRACTTCCQPGEIDAWGAVLATPVLHRAECLLQAGSETVLRTE